MTLEDRIKRIENYLGLANNMFTNLNDNEKRILGERISTHTLKGMTNISFKNWKNHEIRKLRFSVKPNDRKFVDALGKINNNKRLNEIIRQHNNRVPPRTPLSTAMRS